MGSNCNRRTILFAWVVTSVVGKHDGVHADINKRIGLTRTVFQMLKKVWSSANISNATKLKVYETIVLSVLMYNSETWTLKQTQENRLHVFKMSCYGRPLSVSGRACYFFPIFKKKILWPPYSLALVNGGSRKFYTWRTLSVIREVSSWIFSWSPLNYRVGQKVTKFGVFSDRTRKLSALTPERGRIL